MRMRRTWAMLAWKTTDILSLVFFVWWNWIKWVIFIKRMLFLNLLTDCWIVWRQNSLRGYICRWTRITRVLNSFICIRLLTKTTLIGIYVGIFWKLLGLFSGILVEISVLWRFIVSLSIYEWRIFNFNVILFSRKILFLIRLRIALFAEIRRFLFVIW